MSANVQSVEAIERFRAVLGMFIEQVSDALMELDAEMRRMQEWLEQDRPRFWKTQVRLAMDQVHEAQQALHRCLMFPIGSERPSCYEERAALRKAQSREAYCRDKTERLRHWQRTVQHELFEYQGRISQLVRIVEIDVPQAIGVLHKIVRHVEEYQSIRSAEPRAAYDDVGLAAVLWPASDAAENASESAADAGDDASAAADKTVKSARD